MTAPSFWRQALLAITAGSAIALAGCGSTPKDESASMTADRLYRDAVDDMESGAYDRAIKSFERIEGLAAGSLLAQQAQLNLAYLNWRSGEKATALSTIERFIRLNPSSPALDYALYLRGRINDIETDTILSTLAGQDMSERDQRAARDAFNAYKQLLDQFPNSRYATDARRRSAVVVNALSAYEVHVARYYLRRGAYVAAASRAQGAVTDFPSSASLEEALSILVQSYDKLELTLLRDDAERVLRLNFPSSPYLDGNLAASGKPWWKVW